MTTISVTNSEELYAALDNATGGETILLAGGDYGDLAIWPGSLKNSNGVYDSEVTIKSADPDNPAVFDSASVAGGQNITFDGLRFEYVPSEGDSIRTVTFKTAGWSPDGRSPENIKVINSEFVGKPVSEEIGGDPLDVAAVNALGGMVAGNYAGIAVEVRGADGVVFDNNEITGFHRGLVMTESENLTVTNNTVDNLRSDGMDFAEVKNLLVENNQISDMNPWRYFDEATGKMAGDHMDLIQFWTASTDSPTENVIIRGNFLHVSEGDAAQSIFMRNELVDRGQAGEEMFYRNILIEDNVIYNAHLHGTTVGESIDLTIRNNTYIQNVDKGNSSGVTVPSINVQDASIGVTIENNIVPAISDLDKVGVEGWTIQNNLLTQNTNPNGDNYVGDLFIDVLSGANSVGVDLQAIPGGIIEQMGVGSTMTLFDSMPDQLTAAIVTQSGEFTGDDYAFTFDASLTANSNGLVGDAATYEWDFGDGNTATGKLVNHRYDAHGDYEVTLTVTDAAGEVSENVVQTSIADSQFIKLDISANGITDASSYDSGMYFINEPEDISQAVVQIEGGDYAYVMNNDTTLAFGGSAQFANQDQFSLSFDIQRDSETDGGGYIMMWIKSMRLTMNDEGALTFDYWNNEGELYKLESDLVIDDTNWHNVVISYNAHEEKAVFYIDGQEAGEAVMKGFTAPASSYKMGLGYQFKDNFEGLIKDFEFVNAAGTPAQDDSEPVLPEPDDSEPVLPEPDDSGPVLPAHDNEISLNESTKVQGGSELNDLIHGTDVRDIVKGGAGDDVFYMGAGDDHVNAGDGDDFMFGGDGDDYLNGFGGFDHAYGGAGNDNIYANVAYGEAGDDALRGSDGFDNSLDGGDGNDFLIGYDGNDTLIGGAGNDVLRGGDGDDIVVADDTDARLSGGGGHDTLALGADVSSFDFTGKIITSFEVVNMDNGAANELMLNSANIIGSAENDTMMITGDSQDTLKIGFGGLEYTGDTQHNGETYGVYEHSYGTLLVDDNVSVLTQGFAM